MHKHLQHLTSLIGYTMKYILSELANFDLEQTKTTWNGEGTPFAQKECNSPFWADHIYTKILTFIIPNTYR